jgi:hypothetical protein
MTDAYFPLGELLSEVQLELGGRRWEDEPIDRIKRAADLRGKLWRAIAAYRDSYMDTTS